MIDLGEGIKELILESNIVIPSPNQLALDNNKLLPEIINFLKKINYRYYSNALFLHPNLCEIGFDVLGLGITNRITVIDHDQFKLELFKKISFNHFIPYYMDAFLATTINEIPTKTYDLIFIDLQDQNNKVNLIQCYFIHLRSNLPSNTDVILLETNLNNESNFIGIAAQTGLYHVETKKIVDRFLLHFKMQHDFPKK